VGYQSPLGLKPSGKSVVPAGTRVFLSHAFPPLKRWAKLCRPTMWDWIVVGSGPTDVHGL
jgi:hypothetical protein